MEIVGEEGKVFNEEDVDRIAVLIRCDEESMEAQIKCSEKLLAREMYSNLKYPSTARENNISGTVSIGFVVNTDGSMSNIEVLRDIGGGCGQACYDVVYDMYARGIKWKSGVLNGKKVRTRKKLPFTFKLQ
jgi:protein TonB